VKSTTYNAPQVGALCFLASNSPQIGSLLLRFGSHATKNRTVLGG